METIFKFETVEQARNAAIKWLEQRAVEFGPHRKVEIGRLAANVRAGGSQGRDSLPLRRARIRASLSSFSEAKRVLISRPKRP